MKSPEDVAHELIEYITRAGSWAPFARSFAEGAGATGAAILPELLDIQERLRALHVVALVGSGKCGRCAARLTDPSRSPTGARHCRACRVGWTLEERNERVRAVERPWAAGVQSPRRV